MRANLKPTVLTNLYSHTSKTRIHIAIYFPADTLVTRCPEGCDREMPGYELLTCLGNCPHNELLLVTGGRSLQPTGRTDALSPPGEQMRSANQPAALTTVEVSAGTHAETWKLSSVTANPYSDFEAFLGEVRRLGATFLPRSVISALDTLKRHGGSPAVLIKGLRCRTTFHPRQIPRLRSPTVPPLVPRHYSSRSRRSSGSHSATISGTRASSSTTNTRSKNTAPCSSGRMPSSSSCIQKPHSETCHLIFSYSSAFAATRLGRRRLVWPILRMPQPGCQRTFVTPSASRGTHSRLTILSRWSTDAESPNHGLSSPTVMVARSLSTSVIWSASHSPARTRLLSWADGLRKQRWTYRFRQGKCLSSTICAQCTDGTPSSRGTTAQIDGFSGFSSRTDCFRQAPRGKTD